VTERGNDGLTGRTVRLRAVLPQDVGYLYRLTTETDAIWRWRLRGRTPSPSDFETFVWASSDVQFMVERVEDGQPCGHVCTYQTDELGGTTKMAMVTDGARGIRRWPIEGAYLFLGHLFSAFPLRKLYLEVPAFNLPPLASFLDRYTLEEGRLKDHSFGDGRFCDLVIAAMWRRHWEELQTGPLGRALEVRTQTAEAVSVPG
jgi:hypothetical protein